MLHVPARFATILVAFAPVFVQARTWQHAQMLVLGALLVPGQRTVCNILRIIGLRQERHFVTWHRVLNRAVWDNRLAARLLLKLLVEAFVPTGPVLLGVDDSIERRRGKQISAKGIYRDPVRSSRSFFVKTSGLRWLSLMLLSPMPWAGRGPALPDRAGPVRTLLPRAGAAAQDADRLGATGRLASPPLAARARDRAARRQQLRGSGPAGGADPPWRHQCAPAASGPRAV